MSNFVCKLKTWIVYPMGENNDIKQELALLHSLDGGDYSRQVERIALRSEFHPLPGEKGIFVCGGESDSDYRNLLNAARKAVFPDFVTLKILIFYLLDTELFVSLCHPNLGDTE